jgi:GT2 family glycosyltransferase
MALIAMAVYSTQENKKDDCLFKTLFSLRETVILGGSSRLILSVNSATETTRTILSDFQSIIEKVIWNDKNLGTAEAINKAWNLRTVREDCVKMDDDVRIYEKGWLYELEEAVRRDSMIGQVGLKRKDLWECPSHENPFYKSDLQMLPHQPGEKWMVAESVNHVMGTCVLHSSALLDKVGYLYQPGVYGFDDSFMSLRSKLAGFKNVFLPHIDIDHIDRGGTPYQSWKEDQASSQWKEYHQIKKEFETGQRPLYYNPFK